MHFEIVNTANPGPLIGSGTNVIYENVGEAITQLRCCAAPLSADRKQRVDEDYREKQLICAESFHGAPDILQQ